MIKNGLGVVGLCALAVALTGCQEQLDELKNSIAAGAKAVKEKAAPKPGGESPEDVFAKVKQVTEEAQDVTKSLSGLYPLASKKSKQDILKIAGMSASFTALGKRMKPDAAKWKELTKIYSDHGLTLPAVDAKPDKKAEKAFEKKLESLDDAPAFIDALIEFSHKHKKKTKSKRRTDWVFVGELKNLKIKGDKATAKATSRNGAGKEKLEDFEFVKEDGRWFLQLKM